MKWHIIKGKLPPQQLPSPLALPHHHQLTRNIFAIYLCKKKLVHRRENAYQMLQIGHVWRHFFHLLCVSVKNQSNIWEALFFGHCFLLIYVIQNITP